MRRRQLQWPCTALPAAVAMPAARPPTCLALARTLASLAALRPLQPLSITLRGITNDAADCGADVWRTVTFPLLRQLTGLDEFELKVWQQGSCRC